MCVRLCVCVCVCVLCACVLVYVLAHKNINTNTNTDTRVLACVHVLASVSSVLLHVDTIMLFTRHTMMSASFSVRL
jgi:hypothetical protein